MSVGRKPATVEDLLRAAHGNIPAEIVNGELVQKAPASARHANARMAVGVAVRPSEPVGDGVDYNCDTWAWPLGALGGSP